MMKFPTEQENHPLISTHHHSCSRKTTHQIFLGCTYQPTNVFHDNGGPQDRSRQVPRFLAPNLALMEQLPVKTKSGIRKCLGKNGNVKPTGTCIYIYIYKLNIYIYIYKSYISMWYIKNFILYTYIYIYYVDTYIYIYVCNHICIM